MTNLTKTLAVIYESTYVERFHVHHSETSYEYSCSIDLNPKLANVKTVINYY